MHSINKNNAIIGVGVQSPPFTFAHVTHAGIVRESNEDNYIVSPGCGLWLVADGMGGHQDGEIASAVVAREVMRSIQEEQSVSEALNSAHHAIFSASAHGLGSSGMGATAVALCLNGYDYQVAWSGDSRAYLWNGSLTQLTKDHTLIQMLIDQGKISEREAEVHPDRHVLRHSLGSPMKKTAYVETITGRVKSADSFLLCSDGLTNELNDEDIERIMSEDAGAKDKVNHLLTLALDRGGEDNITIILVSMGGWDAGPKAMFCL